MDVYTAHVLIQPLRYSQMPVSTCQPKRVVVQCMHIHAAHVFVQPTGHGQMPVHAGRAKRILVARADMESYIAEKKTHVGNLARGWFARVKSSGGRITLLLGNAVPYAANVTGLQAHANEALRSQLHRLQDRAVTAVAKAAKNAGFKS